MTTPNPVSGALTPAELDAAYGISTSSTSGAGETIGIVDAYNDPNIQADLAAFDKEYNLPTASLTVVNQTGGTSLPQTDAGWSLEIALDVEWAHAAAPGAKIVLVEANSANTSDLMAAVQEAAKSANVVSMSWGGSEFSGETAYDTPAYFANPNVTFVSAAGDDGGKAGAEWPASSPYVLSVGGTTLTLSGSGYGSETAWDASGSRFSGYSGGGGGVSTVEKNARVPIGRARNHVFRPRRARRLAQRQSEHRRVGVRLGGGRRRERAGNRSAAPAPAHRSGRRSWPRPTRPAFPPSSVN